MLNPFSALTSKIYGGIAIAAITFAGIQTVRIEGLWFIDGYVDKLADARDTIREMETASKEAAKKQKRLFQERTDKETDIARKADNDQTTRRDIADRSSAYADRMRAENHCRQASATSEDSVAETDTSAGPDAIVVSRADFDTLTDNTARLVLIKAWGDDLVKAGLAVPVQSAPE